MEKSEFKEKVNLFEKKYRYLLLGGLGFLGKSFFEYLTANNGFEKVVISDKKHLKLSYIPPTKIPLYEAANVKYLQRDLSRENDIKEIYQEHGPFDIVINFAAETRYAMTDDDYKKNTLKLSDVCAKVASANNVLKYIEISNALIYGSTSTAATESSKLEPTIAQAKMKLAAERAIFKTPNLNLMILRPAIVYGPGDVVGMVGINLICSALYKINKEKMRVMWDDSKKINTVHVEDVNRAIIHLVNFGTKGDVFNLADENDTTQEKFYKLLKNIFRIDIECIGSVKSFFAKMAIDSVVSEMNKKHCKWWFEAMEKFQLDRNGPVNVNVYKEMVENYNLSVDGKAIKKLGFEYKHPKMTEEKLVVVIKEMLELKYMPNVLA